MPEFDQGYWESHWQRANRSGQLIAPNPYLAAEVGGLQPGTALDAGCGEGAEAIWLAAHGWRVTAVDISSAALTSAADRADSGGAAERLEWVEADLSTWAPASQFDLVTSHYAHPAMAQLAFYQRISLWVAAGGTLLIVGHLRFPVVAGHGEHGAHQHGSHDDGSRQPEEVTVTAASVLERLDRKQWDVVTADERTRTLPGQEGGHGQLRDVVVRATRRV